MEVRIKIPFPDDPAKQAMVVAIVCSILLHLALLASLFTFDLRTPDYVKRGEPLLVDIAPERPEDRAPLGNPAKPVGPESEPPERAPEPPAPPPKIADAPPAPKLPPAPKMPPVPKSPPAAKAAPAPKAVPVPKAPPPPEPPRQVAKAEPPPPVRAPEPAPKAPEPAPVKPPAPAAQPPAPSPPADASARAPVDTARPMVPPPAVSPGAQGTPAPPGGQQTALAKPPPGPAPSIFRHPPGGGGGLRGGRGGVEGEPIPLDTPEPKYQDYFNKIREKIKANWIYPREAGDRGLQGELLLEFHIAKDGRLEYIELRHSSGAEILDRFAMNAVRLAQPFPPVPDDIAKQVLAINGMFRYQIIGANLLNQYLR